MRYMNRIFVVLLFSFSLLGGNDLLAQSYFVEWDNQVGVDVQDQKITSTAITGWNNSGAYSLNSLPAGQDGWIEIRIPFQNNFEKMVGLADTDADQHYISIDYAFYIQSSLYIYENGSNKLNLGAFSAGEILRIERVGTTILYKRNGTLVYTSTIASSTSLNADISFYRQNAYFENIMVSFPVAGQQPSEISYDIAWTDLVGVSVNGNSITKTATGGWGNGGAASINTLNANTDGWIEYKVDALNKLRTFGFSDINTDASYNTIDYAWHTNATDCYVYLNGGNVGNYPLQVNDILRIERIGSEIHFKLNGVIKRTETNVNTGSLLADCAISDTGAKFVNTKASFSIPYQQGLVPDEWELATLKDIYDSLGGSGWTNKTNWPTAGNWPALATSAEMDTWHGITVINGDITEVIINNNNLTGKIPFSISKLSQLTRLYLYNNAITGTIPSSIGNLTNLQFLYLYGNQLSGSIPVEIGNLENLIRLYLQTNKLTGNIPLELNNLTSIQYFFLNTNLLSGTIPDLSGLSNLIEFGVAGNPNLSAGVIPDWIAGLGNLKQLNLSNTNRAGEIPSWIGNLSSLTHLYLHVNQLTGNIPNEIGNMTSLTHLYLYNNQLSGGIPSSLSNLDNLLYLYLANNQLTGSIPPFLGDMTSLVYLHLGSNKLSGEIPSSLGNLNKLTHLYLNTNQLSGEIPSSFSGLTNLNTLYLYTNKLSGEIPSSIGGLTKLQYVQIGGNQLIGNIPSSFSGLTSMRLFYANSNLLSGDIPSVIGSWPLLYAFNVNYNKFKSLPDEILNNPILTSVSLYNNELTSIPNFSTYSNRANLVLDVRGNRLSFSELELLYGGGIKTLQHTGQKTINDISHASIMGSLTIPARPLTPNTTIIWEKQSGTSWVNVNSSNEDATQQTFYIANASLAEEGVYRYKMTNSVVTGMTIQSDPITVKTAKAFALDNWAFQYKYDGRKRMTHKKVPGADWMYMVYDNRDRLVMTQDGEQRKLNKWSFTKYDALNRPIITGIYTHSNSVDQQGMSGLISTTNFYETLNGDPNNYGYSKNVFTAPNFNVNGFEALTVTYYDNYNFLNNDLYHGYKSDELPGQYEYQNGEAFPGIIGLVSGSMIRTLGGGNMDRQWLRTVNYYDDKHRLVQVVSDDYKQGLVRTTNVYDFVGKVLNSKTSTTDHRIAWSNTVNVTIDSDKIYPTNNSGSWGNSGASSVQIIPENTDGWVEFSTSAYKGMSSERVFGLSDIDSDANIGSIDYGINFRRNVNSNSAFIMENGVNLHPAAYGFTEGDILRIERKGSIIYYKKNGLVLMQSQVPSTGALVADLSLLNKAELYNPKISIPGTTSSIIRTFDYDNAGRLIDTKHAIGGKIPWSELVNVTDFGDKIGKTSGGVNVWDATATTLPIFGPGQDGWVDARVEALSGSFYGFEEIDNSSSVNASYHIRVSAMGSQIMIYKDGSVVTYNGGIINAGDRIKVERSGNTILCKVNDQVRYTFNNVNSANSLRVNAKFLHTNQHFLYDTQYGFPEVLLTHNEYNELGQLIDKKLHSTDPESTPITSKSFKQSVDYRYNIRGWLTKINDSNVGTSSTAEDASVLLPDLFGMNLHYQDQVSGLNNNPLFNGNISAITWSANQGLGAVKQHAYNYSYDAMNRIVSADFQKNISDWAPSNDFQVSGFEYDLNGNIKALSRKDDKGADMDVLTYNYGSDETLGNQLRWVSDAAPGQKGFVDGNSSGDDYLYDANGNMTVDKNKNITAITYNHLNLPEKVTKGTGEYIKYIYDAGGRKLSQQVFEANNTLKKTTDYVGEYVYENDTLRFINTEEGRVTMKDGEAEYQYHLKDHLGNVRVTFTTKDEEEENTATLEASNSIEERGQFLYYDDVRLVNSDFFDKTKDGQPNPPEGARALRLNGSENEKIGLAKSLAVVPGDTVQLEVYAKYVDPDDNNWTTALTNLMANIADPSAVPGTVIDGAGYAYGGSNNFAFGGLLDKSGETGVGPKAYLNYLVFDLNFVPQLGKSGFIRLSDAPKETGTNVAHELLNWEIDITEPGYVYIWLSNEEVELGGTPVEVYFDDFKVTHIKAPVIQSDSYYPFGLSFNSYQREDALVNDFKFNGKEDQNELSLGWYDYQARQYDPAIGRFLSIDPAADLMRRFSPYTYAFDNPIRFTDPDGMIPSGCCFGSTVVRAISSPEVQKNVRETQGHASRVFDGRLGASKSIGLGLGFNAQVGPAKAEVAITGVEVGATYDNGKLTVNGTIGEAKADISVQDTKLEGHISGLKGEAEISQNGVDFAGSVLDRGASFDEGTAGLDLTIEDTKIGGDIDVGKVGSVGGTLSLGEAYKTVEGTFKTIGAFGAALMRETINDVKGATNQNESIKKVPNLFDY